MTLCSTVPHYVAPVPRSLSPCHRSFISPLKVSPLPMLSLLSNKSMTCLYYNSKSNASKSPMLQTNPEEGNRAYMQNIRELWDRCPEAVRVFPWKSSLTRCMAMLLRLLSDVAKWLGIPILFVSSLSEMIYCGVQDKEYIIPIGILAGFYLAGLLRDTAIQSSAKLKEREFPWHLVSIAIFFALIKLPGPYYPLWGRLFLPHLANGGLLRTLWFSYKMKATDK